MPLSNDDIPINLDTEALTGSGFFQASDWTKQSEMDLEQRPARKPSTAKQPREIDALNESVSHIPGDDQAPPQAIT